VPYKNREQSIEYCKKYHKEFDPLVRRALKRAKKCISCGKQDAYTLAGRSRCCECQEKMSEYGKRYYEKNKDAVAEKHRKHYWELREQGICTKCGKRPVKQGKTHCEYCLAKKRRNQKHALPAPEGYCVNCKKEPAKEGFKLCEKCYQSTCERLVIARARAKRNEWWVKDNQIAFQKGGA